MARGTRWGLVALVGAAAACGPGSHPTPDVSIAVSPSEVALLPATTQQFTAKVSGLPDGSVTWSVGEGDAGGSIDAQGMYTAPQATGTYHVVATSRAETSRTASATVKVTTAPAISIDPTSATVDPGATQQFTATVIGMQDRSVDWSVAEGGPGGSVDGHGAYTAPAAAGTYHVVATSHAVPSLSATAEVTVRAHVAVAIAPTSADVATGGSVQFAAAVSGTTDGRVSWSVREGTAGGAVDAKGAYVAPATPGTFHVVATSVADPSASAAASVTVHAPTTVTVTPTSAEVPTGGSVHFTASVSESPDPRVVWSVREGAAGGTIDDQGTYTAPASPGTFHVVATSVADPTATAGATVTVDPPQTATVAISPIHASITGGGIIYFSATVNGVTDNSAVIWSVAEGAAGGAIDDHGAYVAPATPGTYHVVATSRAAPAASAQAVVTVPSLTSNDLNYGYGPVVADAHVYAVWWGDRGAFGDAIGAIETLFRNVSGTRWLSTLDQYMLGARANVTFEGHLYDPSAPVYDDTRIDAVVCDALDAAGLAPDPSAIYFVYFRVPNVFNYVVGLHRMAASPCHGTDLVVAQQVADGHAWHACPDGLSDDAAWLASISTHELAEAMTDPQIGRGWEDLHGQEIADKCGWTCGTFGGTSYLSTTLWSNAVGACVGP